MNEELRATAPPAQAKQVAQLAHARRLVVAFCILLGAPAIAWWARFHVLEHGLPWRVAAPAPAVLAQFLAHTRPAVMPACADERCNVEAAPLAQAQALLQPARLRLPPPQRLRPAAGHAFIHLGEGPLAPAIFQTGSVDFVEVPTERRLPPGKRLAPLVVQGPGYLLSAKALHSGELIPLAAGVAAGAVIPMIDELIFQPVPALLAIEVSGHGMPVPQAGQALRLHLEAPPDDLAPGAARSRGALVELSLAYVQPATGTWALALPPRELARLLDERMDAVRQRGGDFLPEQVWVELGAGLVDNRPHRLPAAAVVRDDAGARVWLAIDGRAVPVQVQELQRLPQHSLVVELPGPLGRTVRPQDWRAMDRAARQAVLQAQRGQGAEHAGLLHGQASVILRPNGLVPGQPLRVRHAGS